MGTIKENYEMMFTSYPDLVDITQLKENAWHWYNTCL